MQNLRLAMWKRLSKSLCSACLRGRLEAIYPSYKEQCYAIKHSNDWTVIERQHWGTYVSTPSRVCCASYNKMVLPHAIKAYYDKIALFMYIYTVNLQYYSESELYNVVLLSIVTVRGPYFWSYSFIVNIE